MFVDSLLLSNKNTKIALPVRVYKSRDNINAYVIDTINDSATVVRQ